MSMLPGLKEQVIRTHAPLIVASVQAALSGEIPAEFERALQSSAQNGWDNLVGTIRQIIAGERSAAILSHLDDEDWVIAEAILDGIQDPSSLPDPSAEPDASVASAGLAVMIHAARTGDPQALEMLANMAEQMTSAGGDIARMGGAMKRLVDGEHDLTLLCQGMDTQGVALMTSLLEELDKLSGRSS